MTWVETNKEPPADVSVKALEMIKLEYELIKFASEAAKELIKTVRKMKNAYAEFCRRVLLTYNRCQTSTARRLEVLPKHDILLKQLEE